MGQAHQARYLKFITMAMEAPLPTGAVTFAFTDLAGARILGYVNAKYTDMEMQREATEQWEYDKLLTSLHETLTDDEINALTSEGAAWPEDRVVEEALKT